MKNRIVFAQVTTTHVFTKSAKRVGNEDQIQKYRKTEKRKKKKMIAKRG